MFELKHVRAAVRDPTLQRALLEDGQISLEKFKNFDLAPTTGYRAFIRCVKDAKFETLLKRSFLMIV